MKSKIKLMVVDDQTLFRQGIISLLNHFENVSVIAEAENGVDALETLKLCAPDVILLDIEMKVMNGIEASKIIKKDYPGVKIIIVSMHSEALFVYELLRGCGVHGYLDKNDPIDVVMKAIDVVYNGGVFVDDEISKSLNITIDLKKPIKSIIGEHALNEEEISLLKLICKGKTGKENTIAMGIPLSTFNHKKNNLKLKTNCESDIDLVLYALRHGFIGYKDNLS